MTDRLVGAGNFTSWFLLCIIAVILGKYLWNRCRLVFWNDVFDIAMAGAMIESVSWALHRQYWWLWQTFRASGNGAASNWFIEHSSITLLPMLGVWTGAIMLVAPVTSYYFGKYWFFVSAGFVISIYFTAYSMYQ